MKTQRIRSLATFALAGIVACLATVAPGAAQRGIYTRLAQGGEIEVHLVGRVYAFLEAVWVVRGSRGTIQQEVTAEVGPFTRGSRILRVRATTRAAVGHEYRVEGSLGRSRMVLPIGIEITASGTSTFVAPPTGNSIETRERFARTLATRDPMLVEPVESMTTYRSFIRYTQPRIDQTLEYVIAETPPGVVVPVSSSVAGGNDIVWRASQWVPVYFYVKESSPGGIDHGYVGAVVTIGSNNMPCPQNGDSARVYLGSLELPVVQSSPTELIARLPKARIDGASLSIVRQSDGAHSTVHGNYKVDRLKCYDLFAEPDVENPLLKRYLLAKAAHDVYARTGATTSQYFTETRQKFAAGGLDVLDCYTRHQSGVLYDTQFVVAQNRDAMIIAFCGSQYEYSLQDAATDIHLLPYPDFELNCLVHAGVFGAHTQPLTGTALDDRSYAGSTVYTLIRSRVAQALASGRQVWMTGHSLGGSIAQLCAVRLARVDNLMPTGVVTFGQFMVGDKYFANHVRQLFGNRMETWTNHLDLAPFLMPHPVYVRAGRLRQFSPTGQILDGAPMQDFALTADALNLHHLEYWGHIYRRFREEDNGTFGLGDLWPAVDPAF